MSHESTSPRFATAGRRWVTAALLIACLAIPEHARADVVDDAYAAGNEAAIAGDWSTAVEHWQRALELMPGRSAQLDYDLGTAYAQLGELGRATYHLERALQPDARPSVEVAEAARRNLGIVRRRAEVQAEVNDARISSEETWWDLFVGVLAGQGLAWISVISGWLLVLTTIGRRLVASRSGSSRTESDRGSHRIGGALALVFASVFVLAGGLHGLAIEAADDHPDAIALDSIVELREGPATHLPVAVRVQGGSHLRVLDERSGWVRVRLPAGLEGWAPRESIARLDKPPMRSRVRADKTEAVADEP